MEEHATKKETHARRRQLKVLCLGLSRTGTMSLRAAFSELGYQGVYHYRVPSMEETSHSSLWVNFLRKKYEKHEKISREGFDTVFSNYEVVTDSPSVFFWEELLEAYPDAMVILQTRDSEAWYKSFMVNIWPMNRDFYKPSWNPYNILFQFFLPRTAFHEFTGLQARYGHGLDFPETGRERYRRHNTNVLRRCEEQGREVLEYNVNMGWGPLCAFLEKEVPKEGKEFPKLNDTADFQKLWAPVLAEQRKTINQKILLLVLGVVGGLSATWWYRLPLGRVLRV